jgi:hypothetical protein
MRDKTHRRTAVMCVPCATREGRKNTITLFLAHRMEHPNDEYIDEIPPQIPPNGARTGPCRHFWCSTLTEPSPTEARLTTDVVEMPSSDTLKLSTPKLVVSIGTFN